MKERHKNVTAALAADRKLRLLLDKGVREKHDIGLSKTPKELSEIKQKLIIEGGRFFQANFFSMFVCMLTGLLSLMFVPGIVTILHFTASAPETEEKKRAEEQSRREHQKKGRAT